MSHEPNSSARILGAALALFSEKGYDATSTREICELAGITKPTLYYFYESKEGIYRALLKDTLSEFSSIVEDALNSRPDLRGRLYRMTELFFERSTENPQRGRFVFSLFWSPNSPFAVEIHSMYASAVKRIADAAEEAVTAGEIRPGNLEARMLVLMGSVGEAVSNFLVVGNPKLTRELADSIVDTVLDGWQPARTGTEA